MIFETETDLLNELEIIKKIAGKNEFKKLDRFGLDYEIPGKAFIEIKKYKTDFEKYQSVIVSCIKLVKMQEASKFLPTYLFIQYLDKLVYIDSKNIEGELKKGGRVERKGSTNDKEFLVYVPKSKFKEFTVVEN
jgi:hypothetical protein